MRNDHKSSHTITATNGRRNQAMGRRARAERLRVAGAGRRVADGVVERRHVLREAAGHRPLLVAERIEHEADTRAEGAVAGHQRALLVAAASAGFAAAVAAGASPLVMAALMFVFGLGMGLANTSMIIGVQAGVDWSAIATNGLGYTITQSLIGSNFSSAPGLFSLTYKNPKLRTAVQIQHLKVL